MDVDREEHRGHLDHLVRAYGLLRYIVQDVLCQASSHLFLVLENTQQSEPRC